MVAVAAAHAMTPAQAPSRTADWPAWNDPAAQKPADLSLPALSPR